MGANGSASLDKLEAVANAGPPFNQLAAGGGVIGMVPVPEKAAPKPPPKVRKIANKKS